MYWAKIVLPRRLSVWPYTQLNLFVLFQDEKNEVLVTNVWLDQVRILRFLDFIMSWWGLPFLTTPSYHF